MSDRPCTCHPSEAPKLCQKMYALGECQAADEIERLRAALDSTDAAKTLWENKAKQHLSRIEHLEAALREIAEENIGNTAALSVYIARDALVEKANTAYYRAGTMATPEERMAAAIDLIRAEVLEAEVKVWQGHTKAAVWSDSEECKLLTRINAALLEAPTVDIDVVVPERDYSAMTPRDCYEAGLRDGVYQAREAIKAATRAALECETHGQSAVLSEELSLNALKEPTNDP